MRIAPDGRFDGDDAAAAGGGTGGWGGGRGEEGGWVRGRARRGFVDGAPDAVAELDGLVFGVVVDFQVVGVAQDVGVYGGILDIVFGGSDWRGC